jgi:NAD(P)H-hydrate epimerase
MKLITAQAMQELDRRTIKEFGVPGLTLMERAGANCAAIIAKRFAGTANSKALIVAGKGNNGGDGFVIARLLAESGWQVELALYADPAVLAGDAKINHERLPAAVDTIVHPDTARLADLCNKATVIVDALFGTGLNSTLAPLYAAVVDTVNSSGRPIAAVDIPSGIDASTGRICGTAVKAALTVTFAAAKLGHFLYPGTSHCGELLVTDIGIPPELLSAAPGVTLVDAAHSAALLSPRNKTDHKGSCGHALIVAGSVGKSGAAAMAANSAVRSGAGLVTLAAPDSINQILEIKTTEAMTLPVASTANGTFAPGAIDEILACSKGKNVMALGPGVGSGQVVSGFIRTVAGSVELPLVIDADGLNALSGQIDILPRRKAPFIIMTPHPGEMARLTGQSIVEIESDRLAAARSFAMQHRVYLLLKGARTVIAAPNGELAINASGNPGMATGGSGDVLTGVIAALVAQGYEPFAACCLGAFIHGLAGDMVAAEKGEIGMNATDIQEMLPLAIKNLSLASSQNQLW